MRKLIFIVIAAVSYWIAGIYRQMPLMILALMEWILFVFLFGLALGLQRNLSVSFPTQSDEAEKESKKKCLIHIERSGAIPLKKVCVELEVYDDRGSLVRKVKKKAVINGLSGMLDFEINVPHCGILRIRICKVQVYDYLSVFSFTKRIHEEMRLTVFPKTRMLRIQPISAETMSDSMKEFSGQEQLYYSGSTNGEIRQIREYRTGDTMRYIHWNQSAKTGKLWFKEFEREDEAACEILLDMMLPENWKYEERDGFYEVVAAFLSGLLQSGYRASVCWYDETTEGFMTAAVEDRPDYRNVMRKLYQSGFARRTQTVEKAYEKQQASLRSKLFKCNLRLECYEIKDSGEEELRHRFTYENLEQELSGDFVFSLR